MAYVEQSDLVGMLSEVDLVRALDDDGDGVADSGVWVAVADQVQDAIDGALSGMYATPFSAPLPATIAVAARVFAVESLYARRMAGDDLNPWKRQADAMRARLERIGTGKEPLAQNVDQAHDPVKIVTEPSKTHSANGNLMA